MAGGGFKFRSFIYLFVYEFFRVFFDVVFIEVGGYVYEFDFG